MDHDDKLHRPKRFSTVAALGVLVIFLGLAGAVAVVLRSTNHPGAAHAGVSDNSVPAATEAKSEYPWAECAAVVRRIKFNSPQPDTVEVLKWEQRRPSGTGEKILVQVKFQTQNSHGALQAYRQSFTCLDGQVYESDPRQEIK